MKKLLIILTAIAMVGAFTATAMAADWGFYGSARVETSYATQNDDLAPPDGVTQFSTDMNGTSRIGANVKVSDSLSGRFEYGGSNNMRLLYGVWNFGGGALIVGQTYTPGGGMTNGNQALAGDYGMYDFGMYESRQPQVTLSFGSFSVGIVQPASNADLIGNNEGPSGDWGSVEAYPTLEAGYNGSFGAFSLGVYGGFQQLTALETAAYDETSVSAYGAGLSFGGNFGAVNFTVQGSYSMNGGYIWLGHARNELDADGDWQDSSTMNATGSIGFTASEMIYVEGGLGYRSSANDTYEEDNADMVYYINCKINMAENVFVVPEISMFDYGKDQDDNDEGTAMYVGAKWQINF